jgi:molybdopterin adenylyltransferase
MEKGKICAVCVSEVRGIQKHAVSQAVFLEDFGIQGDAHAGKWHRQVSLLSKAKIDAFNRRGADVIPGAFGENLVVDGFDFATLPVGTTFQCGDVILEMTQIGKECHSHCQIYQKMGKCIMPTQGVFAKVIRGGIIAVGDEIQIIHEKERELA